MGFADFYLKKNNTSPLSIQEPPSGLLNYIVVIPAFSEPDLLKTLNSLKTCTPTEKHAEVLILVNFPERSSVEIKNTNRDLFEEIKEWIKANQSKWLRFIPLIIHDLPHKHAGVGYARKILMDTAVSRLASVNNPDGCIISLDADTLVPKNYLADIEGYIKNKPKYGCLILNFEHPTSGSEFSATVYNSIIQYELYLRYYKRILRSTGFPYSEYTLGSCFAIKAETYIKVGGMNRRKAGEDFYFLNKVFPVAKVQFLKDIIVIPSPRPSWRVPFGTGPTVRRLTGMNSEELETYNPSSFYDLSLFINIIPLLYKKNIPEIKAILADLPDGILNYLQLVDYLNKIQEINDNCSEKESFIKRFYNWFDSFMVIKYLNFCKKNNYPPISIAEATRAFLYKIGDKPESNSILGLLEHLRMKDLAE